jgi:hypothetical protein
MSLYVPEHKVSGTDYTKLIKEQCRIKFVKIMAPGGQMGATIGETILPQEEITKSFCVPCLRFHCQVHYDGFEYLLLVEFTMIFMLAF